MRAGDDVIIHPTAVFKTQDIAEIGSHVTIDCFTYISTKVVMGDWIHIAPFTSIIGGVLSTFHIGTLSALSQGARIICGSIDWVNSSACSFAPKRSDKHGFVTLEPLTGVAINGIVFPDVKMAIGSILGVNSVLLNDTVPWGVYLGNPARLVKFRNRERILQDAKEMGYEF